MVGAYLPSFSTHLFSINRRSATSLKHWYSQLQHNYHSCFECTICSTSCSHFLRSAPQPASRLILRLDDVPSSMLSSRILSSFRARRLQWLLIHHQMMLSLEKKTSVGRSEHPGLHGSRRRSSRKNVLQMMRGRYRRRGGSSPFTKTVMLASFLFNIKRMK